jgi:hypothetical protein
MSILYLGLDVHKDSITLAVFSPTGTEPLCLERLPYDLHKLSRFLERLTRGGEQIRACYEASGASLSQTATFADSSSVVTDPDP